MAAWSCAVSLAIANAVSLCPRVYLSRGGAASLLTGREASEELELGCSVASPRGGELCAAGGLCAATVLTVEIVKAAVEAVHGSLDALVMRPLETVPQRMGRPVPYGEALRRADMLPRRKHLAFMHPGGVRFWEAYHLR